MRSLIQTGGVQEYYKDFQTYSQGLGYNNVSLRDMFYNGLMIKIKEMMVSQNYDHTSHTYEEVATKALEIESQLDAFKAQQKQHQSTSSGGKHPRKTKRRPVVTLSQINLSCQSATMFMSFEMAKLSKGKLPRLPRIIKARTPQLLSGTTVPQVPPNSSP